MTQLSASSFPSSAPLSETSLRESFSAAIRPKIKHHRLATLADIPKTSNFRNKCVGLFTSGYYYTLLDNMINCSHCGYSFDANGIHDTEQHRRKNLRCPGLGNTGFINFRIRPQFQDPIMNEFFQNEPELFNNGRVPDMVESYTAEVEEAEKVDFGTLTSGLNGAEKVTSDQQENQKQLEKFNELYNFNEHQIKVLFILGMFFSDESIKCSECSFKLNWDLPFFKLINSHYAMSPACSTRKISRINEGDGVLFILLARTISICLPTYVNPTKKVDQSQAIIFAGAGFAFQWRNTMMYCYWCQFVAPEKVDKIDDLFNHHLNQRKCPFIKKFFQKPNSDGVPELSQKFLKTYIDTLHKVASVDRSITTDSKSKPEAVKLLDPPMAYHSFDNLQTPDLSLSLGVSLSNLSPDSDSPYNDNSSAPETASTPQIYHQMKYLSERERIHPNLRSIPTINTEEHRLSSGPAFIGTCVICLASPADQVFVGCGHVATCKDCSIQGWLLAFLFIRSNKNKVGDICLGSCPETVFPKKYSFALGVTEELPLPRGVRELTQNVFFRYFMLTDT